MVGARFSAPVQTDPEAHPGSCTTGRGSFPGVKSGRGVTLTYHPLYCHSQERVELYLYFPMGRTDCREPQCLYSRAIPLLPLWAVRSVQSLSACTVELYLYSPFSRTACTEPQCLYKGALYFTFTYLAP